MYAVIKWTGLQSRVIHVATAHDSGTLYTVLHMVLSYRRSLHLRLERTQKSISQSKSQLNLTKCLQNGSLPCLFLHVVDSGIQCILFMVAMKALLMQLLELSSSGSAGTLVSAIQYSYYFIRATNRLHNSPNIFFYTLGLLSTVVQVKALSVGGPILQHMHNNSYVPVYQYSFLL